MADSILIPPPKPMTPQDYIVAYAKVYNVSSKQLLAVAKCESGYHEDALGDQGKAYGIYQFHFPTFQLFSKELGKDLNYHSTKDQAELAAFAFSKGYSKHWTCKGQA